jgi:HK97 family phage portal protein
MNIFGLHINSGKSLKDAVAKGLSSLAQAWMRGDDYVGGGATMTNAMEQSVWVYACISTIGSKLASIPYRFTVGERGGEQMIESGPLVTLFDAPHPELDRFSFWQRITDQLELHGQVVIVALDQDGAPLRIDQLRRGRAPTALLPIDPQRLTIIMDGARVAGWRHMDSPSNSPMVAQVLLREEAIWLRRPHPAAFFSGLSPLTVARLAASTDFAAARFMSGLMQNNADTGVIVETDQQPSPEQREALLAALKERKRSAGTADRPLLLWGGAKVVKPTLSSTDMQFLENRKFSRQEICAVYGVAQEILGFTEDANRSVSVSMRQGFIENTMLPKCSRIEGAFAPLVRAIDPRAFGWFDVDALPEMQEARRSRFAAAVQGFGIGVPIDVLSDIFDLGLPELEHDGKSYLPFSLQEVGAEVVAVAPATVQAPAEEPQGEPDGNDGTDGNDGKDEAEEPADEPMMETIRRLNNLQTRLGRHVCRGNPLYEVTIQPSIKIKQGKLRRFFREQLVRVLDSMDRVSGMVRAAKAVEDVFDQIEESKRLQKLMQPLLKNDLAFGGQQLWSEIGLADTFAVPPAKAIEFLGKRANEIDGINKTTFEDLRTTLQEGLSGGDTQDQLVARVKEVFDAGEARAETIATTETNIAVQSGRHIGMQEAGVERKGWQTSNLEGTRMSHLGNEQYSEEQGGIPIEDLWPNGLMYPGDPAGAAGEVINCRCFGYAVFDQKANASTRNPKPETRNLLRYDAWLTRMPQDASGAKNVPTYHSDEKTNLQRGSGPLQRCLANNPKTI